MDARQHCKQTFMDTRRMGRRESRISREPENLPGYASLVVFDGKDGEGILVRYHLSLVFTLKAGDFYFGGG